MLRLDEVLEHLEWVGGDADGDLLLRLQRRLVRIQARVLQGALPGGRLVLQVRLAGRLRRSECAGPALRRARLGRAVLLVGQIYDAVARERVYDVLRQLGDGDLGGWRLLKGRRSVLRQLAAEVWLESLRGHLLPPVDNLVLIVVHGLHLAFFLGSAGVVLLLPGPVYVVGQLVSALWLAKLSQNALCLGRDKLGAIVALAIALERALPQLGLPADGGCISQAKQFISERRSGVLSLHQLEVSLLDSRLRLLPQYADQF